MFEALASFHFIRPWCLWLVPAIAGFWWWWQTQDDPLHGWRAQMDSDLLEALTLDDGAGRGATDRWWLAGWLLAVFAIAGPTWRLEPSPFAEDAAPLMILLKAGDSMERGQPSPMDRARLKIADLAKLRKGEPLGLVAYAGSAHLVLPPTRDTGVVAQMAAEVSPGVMPVPGDRLDLALEEASKLLATEQNGGTLLVIADSIESQPDSIAEGREATVRFPIQFLALAEPDSAEAATIAQAARSLDATVQPSTVDEDDVSTLANTAARMGLASVGGESTRWQEAGYWLVPLIALLAALSFRREADSSTEGRS